MREVRQFAFATMLALYVAFAVVFDTGIIWFVAFSFSSRLRLPTTFWPVALSGTIVTACAVQLVRAFRRYQRQQF
jgi:biotin transporter BioY